MLLKIDKGSRPDPSSTAPTAFITGGRNDALTKLAGSMRAKGFERESIEAALLSENERKCCPPLDPREVQNIARSISRYNPSDPVTQEGEKKSICFADVVGKWKREGPIVRMPTGWATFDEAARGGLAFGRRHFLAGAPNAGKTAAAATLAHTAWLAGHAVGILAVDEEPDDVTARFAQMAGFTLDDTESGDASRLDPIAHALREEGVYLYDHSWSVEAAGNDLARQAAAAGKLAVFIVDSVQTSRCEEAVKADAPRMAIAANVRAMKLVTSTHKLLLIATSEMSRAGYGNSESSKNFNDMAAGKESGDIEYAAAVLLVLRSVKGSPDKIHVNVPKLKRGKQVEFFLNFDRYRHGLVECPAPPMVNSENARANRTIRRISEDERTIRELILSNPGVGVRALRALALKCGMGKDRVEDAVTSLGSEVGRRDAGRNKVELYIQLPTVASRG